MRVLRSLRFGAVAAVVGSASVVAIVACNSIVGVEDVRPLRDGGRVEPPDDDADLPPDDASSPDTGPPPGPNVLEVALGSDHTCARKPDGTVKCWGDDTRGQTGTGGVSDAGYLMTPEAVAVTDALHIAAGQDHVCIVHTSGTLSCWGEDQDGQLGDGQSNTRSPVPVDVSGITDARNVACGATFSCALHASGSVSCWGNGLGGQLGNGAKDNHPLPVPVSNLTDAIAIAAGESHACAVKSDGKLVCWGDGVNGQLGNGDKLERTTPTLVPSLDGVAAVATGARSTCALKADGTVFCWGANELGQLGSGAANGTPNPSPTAVSGLDAIAIWAGRDHACAVRRGGAVACWGAGYLGQLGDGQPRASQTTPTPSPTPVSGITNAIGVSTGGDHSCAPTATGAILCWGDNLRYESGSTSSDLELLSPESVVGYP